MGYYQDLDNDLGVDQEVAEHARDELFESRINATIKKRAIRNEVNKQLKANGLIKPKAEPRGAKVIVSCLSCGTEFSARVADRKRGWARYCSKSCKARNQKSNI